MVIFIIYRFEQSECSTKVPRLVTERSLTGY